MPFITPETAVCIVAVVSVVAPPLYAWCDRWLDRTRRKDVSDKTD